MAAVIEVVPIDLGLGTHSGIQSRAMKRGTKIGLGIGCGVLLLGGLVVIVGGYFALNWFEKNIGEMMVKDEQEGREFGKTTDKDGCMEEGMRRSKSQRLLDFKEALPLTAFVDGCLESSSDTPNFCEGVPSMWSMKDSEWGADVCREAGIDPDETGCVFVTKRKHEYCNKR